MGVALKNIVCLFLLLWLCSVVDAVSMRVTDLRWGLHTGFQRVTIICQGKLPEDILQDEHSLVVVCDRLDVSSAAAKKVSQLEHSLTCVTRLVLDKRKILFRLAGPRDVRWFHVPEADSRFRLVVDFRRKQGPLYRETDLSVVQQVRYGSHPSFNRLTLVCSGSMPAKIYVSKTGGTIFFGTLKLLPRARKQLSRLQKAGLELAVLDNSLVLKTKLSIRPFFLPDQMKREGFYRLVLDMPLFNILNAGAAVDRQLVSVSRARDTASLHFVQDDKKVVKDATSIRARHATGQNNIAEDMIDDEQVQSTRPAFPPTGGGEVPPARAKGAKGHFTSSPEQDADKTGKEMISLPYQTNIMKMPSPPPHVKHESNLRLSGQALVRGEADLLDNGPEQKQGLLSRARFELRYDLPFIKGKDKGLGVSHRSDASYLIFSSQAEGQWFGPYDGYAAHDLLPYEAYLRFKKGKVDLRLGRQIVRWGKTDQISPVDNINPQDLREFYILQLEDRKIPTWLARLQLIGDPVTLEGVFIPFFRPHEVDYFGSDWAVYGHLKTQVADDPLLPDYLKDYVAGLSVDEDRPGNSLRNAQAGGRLIFTLDGWDLNFSYLYGFDPTPFISSFPIKNIRVRDTASKEDLLAQVNTALFSSEPIRVDYKRSRIAGLAFETTEGDFGFRGEAAYFSERSYLTEDMTSREKSSAQYVLGMDYLGEDEWYANFQLSHLIVFDYSQDLLYVKRNNLTLNGELREDFSQGNLRLGIRYAYVLTDGSYFVTPYLRCKPLTNWEAELGFNILGGDPDTIWGLYDGNDQLYIKIVRFF